jgi:hypothetical protein
MFAQAAKLSLKALKTKQELLKQPHKVINFQEFKNRNKWDLLGKSASMKKLQEK